MYNINIESLPKSAEEFRTRVNSQEWAEDDQPMVEAISYGHDTVVGILGQMSVYHGTLPSLVERISAQGLRGDNSTLEPETVDIFRSHLDARLDLSRPDIRQSLDLHYFRPGNPIYVATERSTAENYGFPESSRFILQSLIEVSRRPNTPKDEADLLVSRVEEELDKLLSSEGDRLTAIVSLDLSYPNILRSITNADHLSSLNEMADQVVPRLLVSAFSEGNLAVPGPIPASQIENIELVDTDPYWRDTILSGRGTNIFS